MSNRFLWGVLNLSGGYSEKDQISCGRNKYGTNIDVVRKKFKSTNRNRLISKRRTLGQCN